MRVLAHSRGGRFGTYSTQYARECTGNGQELRFPRQNRIFKRAPSNADQPSDGHFSRADEKENIVTLATIGVLSHASCLLFS